MRTGYRWLVLAALQAVPASAGEPQVTLHSTVSGAREQPTVMYIVPWQTPQAGELNYEMSNAITSDVFAPIDRDEFVRELVLGTAISNRPNGAQHTADTPAEHAGTNPN
jgi:hypothetical protein